MDISRITQWFITGDLIKAGSQPDAKQVAFYTGMQCEELAEKLAVVADQMLASSDRVKLFSLLEDLEALGEGFKSAYPSLLLGVEKAIEHVPEELLDCDVDLAWVSVGGGFALTPKVLEAFDAVATANEAKYPNGIVTRDAVTGKVIKPEGWTPPNLKPFVS